MANSVYEINRGVNTPIEFKGLKAQYIWYLAAVVVFLLILFAILYTIGIPSVFCIALVGSAGAFSVWKIYGLSNTYGEHGFMKVLAQKQLPKVVRANSRRVFKQLKPEMKNSQKQ